MSPQLLIAFFLALSIPAIAQMPQDLALPIQVSAGLNPPAVVLTWPNPVPAGIKLSRRVKGQAGNAWITLIDEQNSFQNGYLDIGVSAEQTYEYALERQSGIGTAYGFAHVSIFAPVVDSRGTILVFVDSASADQLGADLVRFKNDLRGEGWQVLPYHTGNFTTIQWIKNKIATAYNADPDEVKAVLLLGKVPAPYAGNTAWDGKPDHVGAWPCDAWYGDVNGVWTDNTVNLPNTARPANRNVPGDGKFDQSILPSAMELAVGRIDFNRLSAITFGASPVELLRKYLLKNHLWRTAQYKVDKQALIDDHLGWSGGDAFAAGGYRNAYPLVGENQVLAGDILNSTNPQRYLQGFAAGTSGTYSGAGGIGTSTEYATNTVNVVFANFYGDYFGDWDFESNPLLPAALASKGGILACGWAGRPHWFTQALASGETMGFCLKETQNAQYNDAYGNFYGESGAHIALLGDPTLRAQVVAPVSNLTVMSNCNKVNLHWTASPDSGILGYIVYRAFDVNGPYARMTANLLTENAWADLAPPADTLFYAVRAMRLEYNPGGGVFYNTSTGVIASAIFVPGTGPTVIGLGGTLTCNQTSLTLGANFQPPTSTVQWYKPDGSPNNGYIATEGGVYMVVATAPNGCTAAAFASVLVDTILPALNLPGLVTLTCSTPEVHFTVPDAGPVIQFTYNGVSVAPGTVISFVGATFFNVSNVNTGCSKSYTILVVQDNLPPVADAGSDGTVLDCTHSSVQLFGSSGTPGVTYAWSGNGWSSNLQNPAVGIGGVYCLTVTAANGCTTSDCVIIAATNDAIALQLVSSSGPCNDGDAITLQANATSGMAPYQYAWSTGETSAEIVLQPGFSGTVGLSVTDVNGCFASTSFSIAPPLSLFALTIKPSTSSAADGSIELLVLGGALPYSFAWSNSSTTQSIGGLTNGTYQVTVTDANDCTVTLLIPLITVGATEVGDALNIRIGPNPAGEVVGVFVPERNPSGYRLRLCDLSGRLVAEQSGSQSVFFFDVHDWNCGVYVLWVETDSARAAYKVMVGR